MITLSMKITINYEYHLFFCIEMTSFKEAKDMISPSPKWFISITISLYFTLILESFRMSFRSTLSNSPL